MFLCSHRPPQPSSGWFWDENQLKKCPYRYQDDWFEDDFKIKTQVKGKPILLLCNKADVDQAQVRLWYHLII